MGTLAENWDEPQPTVAPRKSSLSSYKEGTAIGAPRSSLSSFWEEEQPSQTVAPVDFSVPTPANLAESERQAKIRGAEYQKRQPGFFEQLLASPEVPISMVQNIPATLIGALATGGKADDMANFMQKYGYQFKTRGGQALAEKLGKVTEALPPVLGMGGTVTGALETSLPVGKGVIRQSMADFRENFPKIRIENVPTEVAPVAPVTKGSVGAARVNTNPMIGQLTGQENVRGDYPQYKLTKIGEDVSAPEQTTRASIINRVYSDVGKENNQIRQGVLTGNEDLLRTEHTKAAMANPTPEAELLKRQIAEEQNVLSQFAEKRVQKTGADQNLLYPAERGERVNDFYAGTSLPGEEPRSLPSLFKQEKQKLFQEARDKVGGNPITTNNVDSLLTNKQFIAGLKLVDKENVAAGAKELINLARTEGFVDQHGVFHAPNTIDAWNEVRKALNQGWTPANAKVIRSINEAIDKDIASAGGGDLLKRANDLHQMEKELFASKGIKDIFGVVDSNGVETGKVSFDNLLQKMNSMPVNQWKHIYDVADRMASGKLVSKKLDKNGNPLWTLDVPPAVQQSAQLAKNEILGSLAREVQAAGAGKSDVWLHDAVNKVLNARADKIAYAFPLEEQQAFRDLNAAGYLMPGRHSYEGGGQQMRRVGMIEGNLGKIGTTGGAALGTAVLGPGMGTAVGGYVGGKAGVLGSEALAARALAKEALKTQKQMQKNAEIGKTKLSDIGK